MNNIFLILFPGRKPGLTGRGLYELKPECTKNFNLYFYHFSRAEQSKVTNNLNLLYLFPFIFFFFPQSFTVWGHIIRWYFFFLKKKIIYLRALSKFEMLRWFLCHRILCPIQSFWNKSVGRALGVGLRVLLHGI